MATDHAENPRSSSEGRHRAHAKGGYSNYDEGDSVNRTGGVQSATGNAWSLYPWGVHDLTAKGVGTMVQESFRTVTGLEELLPAGFDIEANYRLVDGSDPDENEHILVAKNTAGFRIAMNKTGKYNVSLVVASEHIGEKVTNQITVYRAKVKSRHEPIPAPEENFVQARFWRMSQGGPNSSYRYLTVPTWKEIEGNYAGDAQEKLDHLCGRDKIDSSLGNIIILHGPPGTGKTTALRAIARSWKKWADCHYIVDPDAFLGNADYMWEVIISMSSETEKCKFLILEDVDELIKYDAKQATGQSFSRLLNLGDGFLGQGLDLAIVLTTNEPVERLNEAITRPGRCMANIEVPKFTREQATDWLHRGEPGLHKKPDKPVTLAEMYELKATEHQLVATTAHEGHGQYL